MELLPIKFCVYFHAQNQDCLQIGFEISEQEVVDLD